MLKIITKGIFEPLRPTRREQGGGLGGWWWGGGGREGKGRGTGAVDGDEDKIRISLSCIIICIIISSMHDSPSHLIIFNLRFLSLMVFECMWFSHRCGSHGVDQNAILMTPTAVKSKGVAFLFMWFAVRVEQTRTEWRHLVAVNVTAITEANCNH